jgi:PTS system mannose-specific IIA component
VAGCGLISGRPPPACGHDDHFKQAPIKISSGKTMIGILIVTHCGLGSALIDAAEFIIGSKPLGTAPVSIDLNEQTEKLRKKIEDGIKEVDRNEGVLILTDMFGGTPSNLSYTFLEDGRVEVLSGVNLPMLVKALNTRDSQKLAELAATVETFGKKSISLASGILKGNKRG